MNSTWNRNTWPAVASAIALLSPSAAADVSVSIVVPPVAPGGKTTATIHVQQAAGVAGAELVITMPDFVLPSPAQALPSTAEFRLASRAKPGRIAIAFAGAQEFADSSVAVLEVPLQIAAAAPPGMCDLTFERVLVCDAQPRAIPADPVHGTLQVLDPPPDLDQDGLPDAWENLHFSGTSGAPDADSDQDGLSDGKEFIAGTDPRSPESVFRIRHLQEVVQAGHRNALLQWNGGESCRYEIYWTDGPLGPNAVWHKVYHPDLRRADSLWSWSDDGTRTRTRPASSHERYYRVVLVE